MKPGYKKKKAGLAHTWEGLAPEWTYGNVFGIERTEPAVKRATPVIVVRPDQPDPTALDTAAKILRRGGMVAFATETVYGLGAMATDPQAVSRIFAAKQRLTAINPVIVHVAGVAQARECVALWPATAQSLAARFWPGPLTLVLNRSAIIPDQVTAGHDTVGVRAPAGKVARGLIERAGQPIAAPSANRANRISPTRAEHVLADLDGRIDLIIDSGPTALGLESTVLDLTTAAPRPHSVRDQSRKRETGSSPRGKGRRPSPVNRRSAWRAPDRCQSTTRLRPRRSASIHLGNWEE